MLRKNEVIKERETKNCKNEKFKIQYFEDFEMKYYSSIDELVIEMPYSNGTV